jgi:hypothetical protein
MFRKCCAAIVVTLFAIGGIFAEDIKSALFVKYDEKDGATFKIADEKDKDKFNEKTFKVDKDATIEVGKDKTKVKLTEQLAKEKADRKYDLKVTDGVITEAKRLRK